MLLFLSLMTSLTSQLCRWWLFPGAFVASAAACSSTVTQGLAPPDPGGPTEVVRLSVRRPASDRLMIGDSLGLVAYGHQRNGDSVVLAATWSAPAGVITKNGWYHPTAEGRHPVRGAARDLAGLTDSIVVESVSPLDLAVVEVTPAGGAAASGRAVQFAARVTVPGRPTAVPKLVWSATGGLIDSTGRFSATGVPGTYQVTARLDGRTVAGSTEVAILPAALERLVVGPEAVAVPIGATYQFGATAGWSDGSDSVPDLEWTATGGTVSSSGQFVAGPTPGRYSVIARSAAHGFTDSASVTIQAPAAIVTSVVLTPSVFALNQGGTKAFSVAGTWSDGSTTPPPVTYSATGGTITAAGLYTAGSAAGTFRVIATALAGVAADTATVTITIAAPPPSVVTVVLTPERAVVNPGGTQQFSVSGAWSNGSPTAPSVVYSATGGTITQTGLYTAGTTAGTFQVVATGTPGTAADTAIVTIRPARPLLGVHSDLTWRQEASFHNQAISAAKNLRAEIARVALMWTWIEFTEGHPDWTVPDRVVQGLIDAGIEPLFVVFGSPSWANGVNPTGNFYYYLHVPTNPVAFNAWVARYQDFIGQAARRYRGRVKKWELWNEPNDAFFWRPSPRIDLYGTWFSAIRSTLLAEDANAEIALGGLNQLLLAYDSNITGRAFLQGLYSRGVFPEIVAIHPYANAGQSPDVHIPGAQNFDDIDPMLQMMASNGQGNRKLWVTEWGWTTAQVSTAEQAAYLGRSLELLTTRYAGSVTVATYFSEYDSPPYSFGLFTSSWVERPAAATFRQILQGLNPAP